MQTLLPPERFEHVVNLQPIEVKNKNSSNENINSAVDPAEPHEDHSTLPEKVKWANLVDNLYTKIYAYLEALNDKKKPVTHLNSCRISNGLLMKVDQLWVPEREKNLRIQKIKKVYDQLAVSHLGVKQTLNMLWRHYYWPVMRGEVEQYPCNCHVCK